MRALPPSPLPESQTRILLRPILRRLIVAVKLTPHEVVAAPPDKPPGAQASRGIHHSLLVVEDIRLRQSSRQEPLVPVFAPVQIQLGGMVADARSALEVPEPRQGLDGEESVDPGL